MKISISLALIFCCSLSLSAQSETSLTIKIDNIEYQDGGDLKIALFDSPHSFKKWDDPVNTAVITISGTTTEYIFPNIPAGIYAIALYHDKNKNNRLDKNFLGIPKEAYGFSNNARGKLGPPGFDAASFKINGSPVKVSIDLVN